jgi:L-ascorbate metabolism protein UlaG (beta-lactamase superfamily)
MSVSRTAASHRTSRTWPLTKLRQLLRLVHESHAQPLIGTPQKPIPVAPSEFGITFIGHSSFLLQVAGKNILIDPVFSTRLILLRRQRHPGVRIADLPTIDLVLITHAHMDHLNLPSLRSIVRHNRSLRAPAPIAVVPTGVDDLLRRIPFAAIHTLSWWQDIELPASEHNSLRITMTPCQHWGARMFSDTHRHFGGYAITPLHHGKPSGLTIYHSGDTAYFSGFHEIRNRLHPDIALLPIGAYFPDSYRGVHTSPEEAVRAFLDLGARLMVPMHYGTFRLGREPMDEPLQRLAAEAIRLQLDDRVRTIAEGETLRIPSTIRSASSARVTQRTPLR